MVGKTQKLSVRLLKDGLSPQDGVREDIELKGWPKIPDAQIYLNTIGGNPPKWASFLELPEEERRGLYNRSACGVVFIKREGRWFAVSFGLGHVALDPAKFEEDFGLRVVLNAVDPNELRSIDVRTPDENTLSRRNQTSRGSDYSAFLIDIEKDIVRGVSGRPQDRTFASRLAGADSLTIHKTVEVSDLPALCSSIYAMYTRDSYKAHFEWIDYIKHIRSETEIDRLNNELVGSINKRISGTAGGEELDLAFPVIYNPENIAFIRYKGFRNKTSYLDLEFTDYLNALEEQGVKSLTLSDIQKQFVCEVDGDGKDCGGKWKLYDCLVFQVEMAGHLYILSAGRWYQIDTDFAKEIRDFFSQLKKEKLSSAKLDENEQQYNERIKSENPDSFLCLDRRLVRPTDSKTDIEVCDFLTKNKCLIHVKDKTSSSRLSHLFNQGLVSGQVLKRDGEARNKARLKVSEVERETGQSGFSDVIASSTEHFDPAEYTVVYAVISTRDSLPFFSLVSLKHAVQALRALDYKCAFAWIEKTKTSQGVTNAKGSGTIPATA